MTTAWQIEGMLSPCCAEVGDISAPVAAKSTRFQIPFSIAGRICPASTEAQQPQPEPPLFTPCVLRS